MGDQPKPVDDEVERALASMRAGFLSGSEQFAAGIASLEEHLVDAPNEVGEAVRVQIARLVAAHAHITAKVAQAPQSSWASFKVMVNAVKQQQTVLDQVSHIVKEHVLPRQLQSLSVTPFPAASPPVEDEPASDGVRADGSFGPTAAVDLRDPPGARRPPRARPGSSGRRATGFRSLAAAGLRTRTDDDVDEPERRSMFALMRERTAGFRGLAAMVAVGIVLSMVPRDRLQEAGARLFEIIGPGVSETGSDDQPPSRPAAPVVPRSVERVPSTADKAAALAPAAAVDAPPVQKPPTQKKSVAAAEAPAAAQAAPKPAAVPAEKEEPATPADDAEERFVPVVFTHKDHATVMRALSDLQQQYPKVLIGLQGEVQPVDLGKKGIWHRLVLLPAGSRPQAVRVCDQLAAEGYDRCWVKAH